jgi:hypothetical protein
MSGDQSRTTAASGSQASGAMQLRQLPSHASMAATIQATDDGPQCFMLRLHDDELSCVLPFLSLADLAQLVRCSHRFCFVARKERSRSLHLKGGAIIAPSPSSDLSHHVSSLHLHCRGPM